MSAIEAVENDLAKGDQCYPREKMYSTFRALVVTRMMIT